MIKTTVVLLLIVAFALACEDHTTTAAPTTKAPTTVAPTTAPSTTVAPTTAPSTTAPQSSWWKPTPRTTFYIQYTGTLNLNRPVTAYDIDLFDTPAATINNLKNAGKKVICYFSAGSFENWRPDASSFPASVKGNNLDGWAGEKWLDVRQLTTLGAIMGARMDLAVSKGCDAVDPDNMDGYQPDNNAGFPLTAANQISYNIMIANLAHARNLSVGLKNDGDQISTLLPYFDFSVNEQCFQYSECNLYTPFIAANKPVFNIEYPYSRWTAARCNTANALNFTSQFKALELTAKTHDCLSGADWS